MSTSKHEIMSSLSHVHKHLMYLGFTYRSVSVIHRFQDLQYHVMFMESVKNKITEELEGYLKANDFTYSIVNKIEN